MRKIVTEVSRPYLSLRDLWSLNDWFITASFGPSVNSRRSHIDEYWTNPLNKVKIISQPDFARSQPAHNSYSEGFHEAIASRKIS